MRLLLLAFLLAGCGGADAAPPGDLGDAGAAEPDAPPTGTVEIGTSPGGFEPLVEGGTIPTYKGPQGGFHVYLTIRATGVDPGDKNEVPRTCSDAGTFKNPCINLDVLDVNTGKTLDSFVPLRLPLTERDGEGGGKIFELVPPRQVTLAIASLDDVDGHTFRITATVDDAARRHVMRELTVTSAPVR